MRYPIPDKTHKWALANCSNEAYNGTTLLKGGTGQYVGYIGEAVFGKWLTDSGIPFDYIGNDSFDADFSVQDVTFDVKTKNRTVLPRDDYCAHIPMSQREQETIFYVFTSVLMVKNRAACCDLMGFISKEQFWAKCEDVKAGTTFDNGLLERTDAGKLAYRSLRSMADLHQNLKLFLKQ